MNDGSRIKFADADVVGKVTDAEVLVHYAKFIRNVADKDYITARICLRNGLAENFLWSSLQAIEKYLKATILFNTLCIVKQYSHVINALINLVESSIGVRYCLSAEETEFLSYVEEIGQDRYAVKNKYSQRKDIFLLDVCVWKVRMYCRKMYKDLYPEKDTIYDTAPLDNEQYQRVIFGYLENLESATAEWHLTQLDALRWHNSYFGGCLLSDVNDEVLHMSFISDWDKEDKEDEEERGEREKIVASILQKYIKYPTPKLQTTSPNQSSSSSSRPPGRE